MANRATHDARRGGQATVEHALFLGMVIAGLIGIQQVVQRGLNARYKSLVDGTTNALKSGGQYEPYYTRSESTVANYSAVTTEYKPGGEIVRQDQSKQVTESGWQRNMQRDEDCKPDPCKPILDVDNGWD